MELISKIDNANKFQPFIKWVGGKRGLLEQILVHFPKKFNSYHEPFLGGGAVFFELFAQGLLKGKSIYLSDINEELINAYNVVKSQPIELLERLQYFKNNHSTEFYYKTRSLDRESAFPSLSKIERATRFIYLNKTCFNGLYRVNQKGYFNTPMGSYKNPNIADEYTILHASKALQEANIFTQDFHEIIRSAKRNDLIYLDPPYYPLTNTSNFTSYNKNNFLEEQQKELFTVFEKLYKKGCSVFQSNSDTHFIKKLYKQHTLTFVTANRFINSKASSRGKINEILIRGKE